MLEPGASVGPYHITTRIGQGGMGEVFQAHDARLGRDVALKVSKEAFSDRFMREARAIAALNHTNICHLYVGPDYLVLEYVEGSTLQGPLSFDDALPIIQQLIDGIEAAHERNIIHRDLKPANIKITPDGVVKILDFGLAKAMTPDPLGGVDVTNSPTLAPAIQGTLQGSILGTAAYMAPEQAKGKPADRRADIWAFGVIVYELLTGRTLFSGESAAEILGHVLHDTPDLSVVPPRARRLLEWCLEKDRKDRLQSIGDARRLLREAPAAPAPMATATGRSWISLAGWAIAALALIGAVAVLWLQRRTAPVDRSLVHLSMSLPEGGPPNYPTISPDGRTLLMRINGSLAVRSLDSNRLRPLAGTLNARSPFWSPDNRTIGFFADGALKTVPASGGPAQVLCSETGNGFGGSWNADGVILFATAEGALKRTQSGGGTCVEVKKGEEGRLTSRLPKFLPDGRHFFYVKETQGPPEVFVASLDDVEGQRLLADRTSADFVPDSVGSTRGHVLFVRQGTLMAQPFDAHSLQLSGDAVPVAEQVGFTISPPEIAASASSTGVIAFVANGTPPRQMRWYDRSGAQVGQSAETGPSGFSVSLAPDGRSLAFVRGDNQTPSESRVIDLASNRESRMFAPPLAPTVVWSPDSNRVAFWGIVDGTPGIYTRRLTGGTADLLLRSEPRRVPSDWSRDGRALLYTDYTPATLADIWLLPLSKPGVSTPVPLLRTPANESQGRISPDGKWLAYTSDESGASTVYVRALTEAGRVSDEVRTVLEAFEPQWRGDGKEIFCVERIQGNHLRIVAVPFNPSGPGVLGRPQPLVEFDMIRAIDQLNAFVYAATPDGQRFVINSYTSRVQPSLDVLLNWPASLAK